MPEPRNRLRFGKITRIALVDQPDNPTATVEIHKRADTTAGQAGDPGESWGRRLVAAVGRLTGRSRADVEKAMDGGVTFDEVRGANEAQQHLWRMTDDLMTAIRETMESDAENKAEVIGTSIEQFAAAMKAALSAALMKATDSNATDEGTMAEPTTKAGEGQQPTPELKPDPVEKAEITALQKKLDEAQERETALAKRVEAMETARQDQVFVEKVRKLEHLPVNAAEFGPLLRKVAGALDEDEFKEVERVFAAQNEIVRVGKLYAEIGSAAGEGTALGKVQAEARKLMDSDPKLTQADAEAIIYKRQPSLMHEVEREEAARADAVRNAR